jgi:chemotaxis protein methyltransferase CheR
VTAPSAGAIEPSVRVDPAGYARLAHALRELLGIDLDQYRPAQMWRRVNSFATSRGLADADALVTACRRHPALLAELRDLLTINVSEFFRDPDSWRRLGRRIRKPLTDGRGFRAWSAGCSIGYEPYSLAILASELAPATRARIVASDIDRTALDVARAGRYDGARTGLLSPARRERFLRADGQDWVVRTELKAMIGFRQHDLFDGPIAVRAFDLVVCRNVVIYFTEAAKAAVHQSLADALRPGGLLFVGATEAILRPARFGLMAEEPGMYVRAG